MRVSSPLGAGLLVQMFACIGCLSPVNSRDKENSSATDELEATRDGESTTTGGSSAELNSLGDIQVTRADGGAARTAHLVKEDGGTSGLTADGVERINTSMTDDIAAAEQEAGSQHKTDAGNLTPEQEFETEEAKADASPAEGNHRLDGGMNDATSVEAGIECESAPGRCDPIGACAAETCQFERSGKSCAFTPKRLFSFTCVSAGETPDFAPCDLDDACRTGSVCVADTFIGRDVDDNPVPRRSGAMCRPACHTDSDCSQGDFCQQATDDANEPIEGLRVCHRFCQDPAECYGEPVSDDIRCTPRDTLLGLEMSECSRKPSNLVQPVQPDVTAEVPPASGAGTADVQESAAIKDLAGTGLLFAQAATDELVAAQPYCLSNWDCEAANAVCVDNGCRLGCERDSECPDQTECLVVDGIGLCSQACAIDSEAGDSCSVTPNCGCSEGQTCRVNDDQTMSCSAVGAHSYMQWCSRQEQCAEGLSCISGLCRPLCEPDENECASGYGACVLTIKSETTETFTCSGDCDPVSPTSTEDGRVPCGVGGVCIPSWDITAYPHALCVSEDPNHTPRVIGEVCSEDFDCASGLGCDANGTCQAWCRSDADCDGDERCETSASIYGLAGRFGLNAEDTVGLCQLP
jgi:hypothetical protein